MQLWSHDLLSTHWKASSGIWSQSKGRRTRDQWCKSQSEFEVPSTRSADICVQKMHVVTRAESKFFPLLFCSIWTLDVLDDVGEGTFFASSTVSSRNTFLDTLRNDVSLLSGHNVAQSG